MREQDVAVWSACESLADMGQATARWLRGEVEQTPCYLGPPNDETAEIVDDLVALNLAGFVTTGSQPGSDQIRHADGQDYRQRAYLEGYADWATAITVIAACERVDGLVVHSQLVVDMPEEMSESELDAVPRVAASVRLADDMVKTSIPVETDHCESDMHFRYVGEGAWDAGQRSLAVSVVDTQWGRKRCLWDTVRAALGASASAAA